MQVNIPNNADPIPALDKMLTHFMCLQEIKFKIPDKVQIMMLLTKAPPSMEVIIQVLCVDESKIDIHFMVMEMSLRQTRKQLHQEIGVQENVRRNFYNHF